jgi:hypothetical protein
MATATRRKAEPEQVSFEEIARRKLEERISLYRAFVAKRADGETLTDEEAEQVMELLDGLALPTVAFEYDTEKLRRYHVAQTKHRHAENAEPENHARGKELAAEADKLARRVVELREEARRLQSCKSQAYAQTLRQLELESPHVLAPLAEAVKIRGEELNRRRKTFSEGVR